jgi:hypothetical protein
MDRRVSGCYKGRQRWRLATRPPVAATRGVHGSYKWQRIMLQAADVTATWGGGGDLLQGLWWLLQEASMDATKRQSGLLQGVMAGTSTRAFGGCYKGPRFLSGVHQTLHVLAMRSNFVYLNLV